MDTCSGNSSGTLKNSSSEEDLQTMVTERKRKRMQSNRDSARRSRMRKQKHLDDLTARVALLRKENSLILSTLQLTTQQFMNVEAENCVLSAQYAELTTRLDSLNEMLKYVNLYSGADVGAPAGFDGSMIESHWCVNQPIIASADYDVFGY